MSRIVQSRTTTSEGDEYLERVAKYVPVEVVAAYLATNRLFPTSDTGTVGDLPYWEWAVAVFAVCWVVTPIYIWRLSTKGEDWKAHAAVSSAAFPIWAFAIGGLLFEHFKFGPPFLPSILLILFSLLAGLVEPRSPERLASPK
jgi:predicted MFS family arabinose efflux permease